MCIAALAMGTLLAIHIGCDGIVAPQGGNQTGTGGQSTDVRTVLGQAHETTSARAFAEMEAIIENYRQSPESVDAMTRSMERVLANMFDQIQREFDSATVLEQAQGALVQYQETRARLQNVAGDFFVNSEVARKNAAQLEDEAAEAQRQFGRLQDIARNAGLPARNIATEEDLAKTIRIGANTYTGRAIYDQLSTFRDRRDRANALLEIRSAESENFKRLEDDIRSRIAWFDSEITRRGLEIDRHITGVRIQDAVTTASGFAVGTPDDDRVWSALQQATHRMEAEQDRIGQGSGSRNLESDLRREASPPMTDHPDGDLI